MTCYRRTFSVLLLVIMVCVALGTSESRVVRERRHVDKQLYEAMVRLEHYFDKQKSLDNEGKCHVCPICGLVHGGLPSNSDNTAEPQEMRNTENSESVGVE